VIEKILYSSSTLGWLRLCINTIMIYRNDSQKSKPYYSNEFSLHFFPQKSWLSHFFSALQNHINREARFSCCWRSFSSVGCVWWSTTDERYYGTDRSCAIRCWAKKIAEQCVEGMAEIYKACVQRCRRHSRRFWVWSIAEARCRHSR